MKTTFTKSKQVLARYLLVGALALTVASCSQSPGTTLNPGKDAVKALVYGPVESDFLEPLKSSLALTVHDGSQKLEDFDMVILDGDHHTPAALKDDALVQEALRSGKWVLALDVTAEHKREGLGDMLLSATDGTSPAYAAHVGQDANGRPLVQIIEYPSGVEPVVRGSEPTALATSLTSVSSSQEFDPFATSAFTDLLLERIAEPAQLQLTQAEADDLKDVVYQTISYSTPVTWTITGSGLEVDKAGQPQQHPNFTANYTFTVFLNAEENPNQLVLVETDLLASPKLSTENFIAKQLRTHDNHTWDWNEWGWFQSYWRQDINPDPLSSDYNLILQKTSPENQNGSRTVTSGVSFSIGVNQAQGGNASVNFSKTTSKTITDWKINNLSTGNNTQWYYRTQYPVDNDIQPPPNANGAYCDQEIYRSCYIKMDPNDLSVDNLNLTTLGLWRTEQNGKGTLVDGWVNFDVGAEHGMLDLFCAEVDVWWCDYPDYNRKAKPVSNTYHINLGAVIPVPIQSLTFSPSPVKGGTPVTGTVTLSKPAPIDTQIKLSSNSENASVLPSVTVKQGQTSATFQVLTSANGIAAGGSTVATITAFYAQSFQAQLTITN